MDVKAVHRERTTAKSGFTRCVNSTKNAIALRTSPPTIERKINEVREKWDAVQLKHDMYLSLLSDEDGEKNEEWIEQLQEAYDGVEGLVEEYLEEYSTKALQKQQKGEQELALRLRDQEIMMFKMTVEGIQKLFEKPAENDVKISALKDALLQV